MCQCFLGFCDDEQAGSVLINAVNQTWSPFIALHLRKVLEMKSQRIDKRCCPVLVSRVHHHSGRLVNNQELVVLIDDV